MKRVESEYPLPPELELCIPETIEDMEKLGVFNLAIHGEPDIKPLLISFFKQSTRFKPEYFPMICEQGSSRIVSSLCLIPWKLSLCGIPMEAAEMGVVATAGNWRNRGLSTLLTRFFFQQAEQEGFLLSLIQGIPGYYRRFGYTYAHELEQNTLIEAELYETIEAHSALISPTAKFRRVTEQDIPGLELLYREESSRFDLTTVRNREDWRNLMQNSSFSPSFKAIYTVEEQGRLTAYCAVSPSDFFPDHLNVTEAAASDAGSACSLLGRVTVLAKGEGKDSIRLNLPTLNSLAQAALGFGARSLRPYPFYFRTINAAALLNRILPLLNRRMMALKEQTELLQGCPGGMAIGIYGQDPILLELEGQQFSGVKLLESEQQHKELETRGGFHLQMTQEAFTEMVTGWRTPSELMKVYSDFWVGNWWYDQKLAGNLLDQLFPKVCNSISQHY